MQRADYVTTIPRALLALLGGAVTGALVFLLELMILFAIRPTKLPEMAEFVGFSATSLIGLIALFSFIFFAGGLLVAGSPAWFLLHRLGYRNWPYAVLVGSVLGATGFIAMVMWNPEWPALSLISFLTEEFGGLTAANGQLSAEGWEALVRGAIGIAIAGALAGFALWKIAYRPARQG